MRDRKRGCRAGSYVCCSGYVEPGEMRWLNGEWTLHAPYTPAGSRLSERDPTHVI